MGSDSTPLMEKQREGREERLGERREERTEERQREENGHDMEAVYSRHVSQEIRSQ